MNGALGCGVRNDVDAQGAEQRAHNGPHPAIFDKVVEILQGEAGPQGGLIAVELLAESVEVPIIPRCSIRAWARRISSTMVPAAARESMTQICFPVLLQHHLPGDAGRVIRAGELEESVKQTVRSPRSKAPAKSAGEGQADEEAAFSTAMAESRAGTDRASSSTNSRPPTWMRRGTVSNRTQLLWKEDVRRSQLLSLTIFHVIKNTPKSDFKNDIFCHHHTGGRENCQGWIRKS